MKKYITLTIIIILLLAITVAGIATEVEQLKQEVHLLQKIVGGE